MCKNKLHVCTYSTVTFTLRQCLSCQKLAKLVECVAFRFFSSFGILHTCNKLTVVHITKVIKCSTIFLQILLSAHFRLLDQNIVYNSIKGSLLKHCESKVRPKRLAAPHLQILQSRTLLALCCCTTDQLTTCALKANSSLP